MSYYHRVPTENTGPELEVQKILASLKVPFHTNEWLYTKFNQVHPIKPDAVATRAIGNPMHVVILCHGVHWHAPARRHLKDEEKRAILEAEDYHVLEIAVGTRVNKQFWAGVRSVIERVLIHGENIKYCGRIKDALALSWSENQVTLI
jgi:hypothetical protein